jgi:hypothetical protein
VVWYTVGRKEAAHGRKEGSLFEVCAFLFRYGQDKAGHERMHAKNAKAGILMDMLRCDGEKGMARLKNMRGTFKHLCACVQLWDGKWLCMSVPMQCSLNYARPALCVVGCGKHFFERLRKTRSVNGKTVPAYIVGPALEGKHPGLPLFFKALRAMTTGPKEFYINKLTEEHGHPDQQDALRCVASFQQAPFVTQFLYCLCIAFNVSALFYCPFVFICPTAHFWIVNPVITLNGHFICAPYLLYAHRVPSAVLHEAMRVLDLVSVVRDLRTPPLDELTNNTVEGPNNRIKVEGLKNLPPLDWLLAMLAMEAEYWTREANCAREWALLMVRASHHAILSFHSYMWSLVVDGAEHCRDTPPRYFDAHRKGSGKLLHPHFRSSLRRCGSHCWVRVHSKLPQRDTQHTQRHNKGEWGLQMQRPLVFRPWNPGTSGLLSIRHAVQAAEQGHELLSLGPQVGASVLLDTNLASPNDRLASLTCH